MTISAEKWRKAVFYFHYYSWSHVMWHRRCSGGDCWLEISICSINMPQTSHSAVQPVIMSLIHFLSLTLTAIHPANTRHRSNVVLMLGRRLRRRANINQKNLHHTKRCTRIKIYRRVLLLNNWKICMKVCFHNFNVFTMLVYSVDVDDHDVSLTCMF